MKTVEQVAEKWVRRVYGNAGGDTDYPALVDAIVGAVPSEAEGRGDVAAALHRAGLAPLGGACGNWDQFCSELARAGGDGA